VETKEVEEVQSQAATHGVLDLAAALAVLNGVGASAATDISAWAQYAEVKMRLDTVLHARDNVLGFELVMPGTAAAQVHAKARDGTLFKLQGRVSLLASQLGLLPGAALTEEQTRSFTAGAKELAEQMARRAQEQIAEDVFRLFLARQDRSEQSGRNAISNIKLQTKLKQ
jgi:hypothetical protein